MSRMDLRTGMDWGDTHGISDGLLHEVYRIAKEAEWSAWNPEWNAMMCPGCGGPASMRIHAIACRLDLVLAHLEMQFPQVTRPIPLTAEEQAKAAKLLGEVSEKLQGLRERSPYHAPRKQFWKP